MLKIIVLLAATLALSACILVPVGHRHSDNNGPESEHHDDFNDHRRDN